MNVTALEVSSFWFSGDISENYKNKWFPTGSSDIQARTDIIITERFKVVLDSALRGELSRWKTDGIRSHIALIIVLDQFSRHIFRNFSLAKDADQRVLADRLALEASEELLQIPAWDEFISTPEFVFALMPLRHNASMPRLATVLRNIDNREHCEVKSMELLTKFRKQTLRRFQELQDRSKVIY